MSVPAEESVTKASIHDWIVSYVAHLLGMPKTAVDSSVAIEEFGLDSTAAAGLSGDLSDWLGIHLEANLTKEYRTIDQIVDHIATRVGAT